MLDTF